MEVAGRAQPSRSCGEHARRASGQTVPTTVLVADADAAIRSLVRLTLGDRTYRTVEAATADAAAAVVAAGDPPGIVILDAELPGSDALELARRMTRDPAAESMRVLLVVERGDPVDEDAARDAGVDAFLAKPFNSFALLRKVAGLTDGAL